MKIRSRICHVYRKFHNQWTSLARPLRVLLLLAGTALSCFLLYLFLGSPALSDEQRYRRAERANLVGPAKILDIRELQALKYYDYDRILIADDGEGIIMYLWNSEYDFKERLSYRKKAGEVTVYAAPIADYAYTLRNFKDPVLPVYAFDNFPNAIHAELDITLNYESYDNNNTKTIRTYNYALEAEREKNGFFCFYIQTDSQAHDFETEAMVLESFANLTYDSSLYMLYRENGAIASIRLYDKDMLLLHEETLYIHTIPMESLIERGELR